MTVDWSPLKSELAIWRSEGRALPLWWRDDDAIADTPALRKLLQMGEDMSLPVHLAVIPEPATNELVQACAGTSFAIPIVHGWAHRNNAPADAKKAEFGHPRSDAAAQTDMALTRLKELFGAQLLEMFVPPWNRIDASVVNGLHTQGYHALSTFTPRATRQVAGLVQINTHIDPIHWRGGGALVTAEALIDAIVRLLQDRRAGATDGAEPLGFLSHHLVHDAAIWGFTQNCLGVLLDGGATPLNLRTMKGNLP